MSSPSARLRLKFSSSRLKMLIEGGQRRDHLGAAAEFLRIVEVGAVDDVLQIVCLGDGGDRGVDALADVLGAAQLSEVFEGAP